MCDSWFCIIHNVFVLCSHFEFNEIEVSHKLEYIYTNFDATWKKKRMER